MKADKEGGVDREANDCIAMMLSLEGTLWGGIQRI